MQLTSEQYEFLAGICYCVASFCLFNVFCIVIEFLENHFKKK